MSDTKPQNLESYLAGDYFLARAQISEIEALLEEVLAVFARTFNTSRQSWPYQLVNDLRPEPPFYSSSTTAMIAFALGLETGRVRDSLLVPAVRRSFAPEASDPIRQKLETCLESAIDGLVRSSANLAKKQPKNTGLPRPRRMPPLLVSATFGWDDPFTLTWLLELLAQDPDPARVVYRRQLRTRGWTLARLAIDTPDPLTQVLQIHPDEQVSHSFPLLRALQLGELLSQASGDGPLSTSRDLHRVHELLRLRVHEHLSQIRIPDSEFDVADLVFALEAWILSSPVQADQAVVDRVFEVIRESQEGTPYWRPLRPFKVTQRGLALLPQSVEVANSLLRICDTPTLRSADYFSKHRGLLERYARWLLGRVFRGFASQRRTEEASFVGWESEHTYTLNSIHLWQTSQAIIFLRHYSAMLQRHIENESLRLAGFPVAAVESKSAGINSRADWRKFVKTEPLSTGPKSSPYHVYAAIETDFITPRTEQSAAGSPSFSMLLYGPPGTGKSTVARKLAQALDYGFITVTPSDFIAGGGEEVEARAKAIFAVLQGQTNLVVLFDEIDHLLLARDSALYTRQGDLFQLLTPGMLTKLNALAERRRVLFVVATNYYEHIDRAVKRPGRIDARYLVLPPCKAQRARHLAEQVKRKRWEGIPTATAQEIVKTTVYFTYRELKDLVAYVDKRNAGATGKALGLRLIEATNQLPPIIGLEGYQARLSCKLEGGKLVLGASDSSERPWEEFALLAYLQIESGGKLPDEPDWIRPAVRKALELKAVADPTIAARLDKAVPQYG
jgi:hypothetical protein